MAPTTVCVEEFVLPSPALTDQTCHGEGIGRPMQAKDSKANGRRAEKTCVNTIVSNKVEQTALPLPHLLGSPDRRPAGPPDMIQKQVATGETLTEFVLKNLQAVQPSKIQPPPGLETDSTSVSMYGGSMTRSSSTAEIASTDCVAPLCEVTPEDASFRQQRPLPDWLAPKANKKEINGERQNVHGNISRSALREKGQNALATMQKIAPKDGGKLSEGATMNLDSLRARGNNVLAGVCRQKNKQDHKFATAVTNPHLHRVHRQLETPLQECWGTNPSWGYGLGPQVTSMCTWAGLHTEAIPPVRAACLEPNLFDVPSLDARDYTLSSMEPSRIRVPDTTGVSETIDDQFIDNVFDHNSGSLSVKTCTAQDGMPMKIEITSLMTSA